jgi:hypothetical protein
MPRSLFHLALAAVLTAGLVAPAAAQAPPAAPPSAKSAKEEPSKERTGSADKQDDKKKEEEKPDPKIAEYEKAISELKKTEGPFTLYQRGRSLLLELPEERLGKPFHLQASFHTGLNAFDLQAGAPAGGHTVDLFRFERKEGQVWLMKPHLAHRWGADNPFAAAAARSFPEAIVAAYKVEAEHPEKKLLLIDVTPMFLGDALRFNELITSGLGGPYALDAQKSMPERIKGFPENTIVQMRLHYMNPRGVEANPLLALLGLMSRHQLEDSRSAPVTVTFNAWFRKEDDYRPRLADSRVGYFTQDYFSLDRLFERDRTERFIMRFRLEKQEPEAEMSAPVRPIVWTIDPSIPEKYRPAVREGILRWNRAFEAIGYKDAIVVQDAPTDEDYDHADGRFNVVRMIASRDSAYAVAIPRYDPVTGEVLNASVSIDANMISALADEHQNFSLPASVAPQRAMEVLHRMPGNPIPADAYVFATEQDIWRENLSKRLGSNGWHGDHCTYAHGLTEHAVHAWHALKANPAIRVSLDEYVNQFIADVISHEIGHCLGLRHNFAASTHLTTEQLANPELTSRYGIAASVMDYTPVNVQAVLKGRGDFFMPTLGAYDLWAIRYGYGDVPRAKTPHEERFALSQIARASGAAGHAFLTDEEADGWNPYAVRFDAGSDPVKFAERMMEASRRVRGYAIEHLPLPGDSYTKRSQLIMSSITQTFRQGRIAARFVGGVSANRNHRGDEGERPVLGPIDGATQREAMRLVVRNCFTPDAFDMPNDVLQSLSLGPDATNWNAPLRLVLGQQQQSMLATLLSAGTTDRIAENSFKTRGEAGAYGLEEHYGILLAAIFSEVGQNRSIPELRRDLQRFTLSALISQAGAPQAAIGEDVRMICADSIRRLATRFEAQLKNDGSLDGMTRVHLRDSLDQMNRFMNRTVGAAR